MLKISIVCAFTVFFLIVSVNGEFLGFKTKSTGNNAEEPTVNVEQGTTEGNIDDNDKGDVTPQADTRLEDYDAVDPPGNGKDYGGHESNENNNGGHEDNEFNNEDDENNNGGHENNNGEHEDNENNNGGHENNNGGHEDNVNNNGGHENNEKDNGNGGHENDDKDDGNGEDENNVTMCGNPPEIEEAMSPDLDDTEHAVGTVIKYQCNLGYVSQISGGFPSVCKINEKTKKAEWTEPEISCSPRSCGDPGYVTNGRRIGNLFTFPNKIEFQCDEGYKLKGLKSRYCQARGDWSGRRLPTCELIYCSEPANPVNGRVSYTSLGYGSELRYECNRGFVLKNPVTKVCGGDGKWSKEEPDCIEVTCEKPLQPQRGTVQFSDGQAVGSLATYSCKEGTTLVGVALSKCLEDGKWTFDPPKCLRSCKIPEIENGVIGFLRNVQRHRRNFQEFEQFQVGQSVKHYETVTVRCNEGFIPVNLTTLPNGDNYVSCSDGIWSESMQCAPSRCLGDVPYLENATPVVPNNSNGSVMWYRCNVGLERLKKGHVQCVYGTWKGQPPVCGDSRCYTNGLNYPGLRLPKEMYFTSGRSFEINCEDGYEKRSSKRKIRCLLGSWEIEENPCTIRDQNPDGCNQNEFFLCNNGRCIPKNGRCDGYNSCGDNSDEEHCGNSKCEEDPPGIPNGRIAYFDRKHGSKVEYQCDESFVMEMESSVVCNVDKWEGDPPLCQKTRCSTNGLNYPGLKLPSELYFTSGRSFEISCEDGYEKISSKRRIRCFQGTWEIEGNPCTIRDQIGQIHHLEIKPEVQNNLDGEKHATTTEVPSSTSSSVAPDTCYCTYDYPDDSVSARSGNRAVDVRSVIKKGETVSLFCRYAGMDIVWTNGLAFYGGTVKLTCDTCKNWTRDDLPHCRVGQPADSFLLFNNDMKILPGGIVEIPRHSNITLYCRNTYAEPTWNPSDKMGTYVSTTRNNQYYTASLNINEVRDLHAGMYDCYYSAPYRTYRPTRLILKIAESEIQCPLLEKNTNRGIFNIQYENDRKVHSVAIYACVSGNQKLIGPTSRECMANGKWSGSYPSCEDITCQRFLTYNSLEVAYTNDNKVNSRATFRCGHNTRLIGSYSAVCMHSGKWSNQRPTCEMLEIRCPALNGKGIFSIYYDNDRRVGSNAAFHCVGEGLKVSGCAFRTCQENGEWSGDDPTCVDYESCTMFEKSDNLDVFYSNDIKVGSTATFSCVFPYTLVGNHEARCLRNGTWNSALPSCEAPKCSVDNLFQILPQEVSANLINVTDDYVPYGSELQLVCEPNSFLSGSSNTKCGLQGRWEHGAVKCIQGCTLGEITSTSQLLVETVKDYYLFGEAITFSCPPGQKLNSEIQRVMCLGTSWSDPIPDCEAAPQANPSNSTKRQK